YQNEITKCQWRIRSAARDIGAFESTTTNSPIGPYDPAPRPRLGIAPSGANAVLSWPLFAQDFQLEQSPALPAPAWTPVAYSSSTDAMAISLSAPATASKNFFRLRR